MWGLIYGESENLLLVVMRFLEFVVFLFWDKVGGLLYGVVGNLWKKSFERMLGLERGCGSWIMVYIRIGNYFKGLEF